MFQLFWFCCLAPFLMKCLKKNKKKKKDTVLPPSMETIGSKSKKSAAEKSKKSKKSKKEKPKQGSSVKTSKVESEVKTSQKRDCAPPAGPPKAPPKEVKRTEEPKEIVEEEKKQEESKNIQPYPSVKEPTTSTKQKKDEAMDKDKKDKITSGFFQSKSDEDDTLEKITSLKPEESDKSRKIEKNKDTKKK